MKLLDTTASNTKIAKTVGKAGGMIRMATLSMMPALPLCPGSKAAGCMPSCLKSTGRGAMSNVIAGRQAKTDWFMADPASFMDQLCKELGSFDKLCKRQDVQGVVRLNVLSDVPWEALGIPQLFPDLQFLDYTKRASRLGQTPDNYNLIFSYSGRTQYAKQVELAMQTDVPMAVVFRGGLPEMFMGRKVIDGDASDWDNVNAGPVVVGLKAKGKAKQEDNGFVVDVTNIIATSV